MKVRESKTSQLRPISVHSDTNNDRNSVGSEEPETSSLDIQEVESFEDLLKICGDAGWWQLRVFLLASFCGFLTALQNLVYAFIGAIPNHWCRPPQVPGYSVNDLKNLTIPLDKDGEYGKCVQFKRTMIDNWTEVSNVAQSLTNLTSLPFHLDRNQTEFCSEVDFDTSEFTSTIVTDFNLICGSRGWASVIQAVFMIGILFGSPIFGSISDTIGRRKTILISSLIFIMAGPLVALSPNFTTLMIARFILGASTPGIYSTSFVLVIESVGPSWRGVTGNLFCLPFAFGYMALPGVAYFFRNWRHLQLVLSAPSLLQIFVCWYSSESPRWLLRKGRVDEAERILLNAANANGRIKYIPSNFHQLVQKVGSVEKGAPEVVKTSWLQKIQIIFSGHAQLFKTPKLRTRILVLYFCWLSISMVYYGVALNSPNLSTDRYWYTFLSGLLEIPSYAMVPPLIKFIGRRLIFSAFLLLCGLSLLSSLLITQGSVLIVVLALVGKLLIGAAYALIYLYATEVIPTLLRTFGVGSASMIGRIGSASAPFIVDLMGGQDKRNPTLVFGLFSLVAGGISFLLPETKDKRLPETIADVETDNF